MCFIPQTWCQIQRTSTTLRNVNCDPGHTQCIYSSACLGFNIQLKVAPLLLEISRQLNVRYTASFVQNTAHILQFTQFELWSRTYTMKIQFRIFWLQYSNERIYADIGDMSAIQCALFYNLCAKHQITLFELWSLTYTMYLQIHIFRTQYSAERICAATGDMSTIQRALYCNLGANSAHILQNKLCELWSRPCTV
jgi:hypothetical protein